MDRTTRLIIWNQLEIMKLLQPAQAADLSTEQEIIADGYTSRYGEVLQHISAEEASEEMQREVWSILDMFRALDTAKHNGWTPSDPSAARFRGFDGNNDDHYHFAQHLLDQALLYDESAPNKNSHSQSTLHQYRRMLRALENASDAHQLTASEAESVITA